MQAYPFAGTDVSESGGNKGNTWRGIGVVDAFGNYSLAWTNTGLSAVAIISFIRQWISTATRQIIIRAAKRAPAIRSKPVISIFNRRAAAAWRRWREAWAAPAWRKSWRKFDFYRCRRQPHWSLRLFRRSEQHLSSTLIVAETNKPLDFAFSPDLRTVYISDNGTFTGTSSPAGGLQRWDASASGSYGFYAYHYSYTLQMGNGSAVGARALNVDFGSTPTWGTGVTGARIFVTTAETSGNRLLKIIDTGAASSATTLITAPVNEMLCGIRFGPTFVNPSFSIQPQSQTSTYGAAFPFSAFAIGTGPLTYQRYFQSNGTGAFVAIAGATNGAYTINSSSSSNAGNYYVIVTGPDSIRPKARRCSSASPPPRQYQ